MKSNTVKLNLPMQISFRDYHEGLPFCTQLNQLTSQKVKCKEIGLLDGEYVFIFHLVQDEKYKLLEKNIKEDIKEYEKELY